ncbi:MAG TPA: lysylphosphatidylglycerol synthase domain-containing protein, partial [Chloroflexota bacterium]|nr:lysylphosphatidylglycerol synthase domain-containing protein [Chloroflexota bacterium]
LFALRPVAVGIAMSFPILVFGILALLMAARSIDLQQVGFFEAHAVYSMLLLLGGISPLPQGLGVAESSGTFYFAFLGVDPSRALVAVLVFRAAILGLSAVIGLIAFMLLRWAVPDLKTVSVRGRNAAGLAVRRKERNPSPASAAGHLAA